MILRRHTPLLLAAVALAGAAGLALAEAGESAELAGADDALWAVISDVDKTYRVIRRLPDKGWTAVLATGAARPVDLAASADGLTVFFAEGEYVRYMAPRALPVRGLKPPEDLWPRGTRLLAGAVSADGTITLLAVRPVRGEGRGAATRAATAPSDPPATGPSDPSASTTALTATRIAGRGADTQAGELALLEYSGGRWSQKSVHPLPRRPRWAALARLGGIDYVLLADPPRLLMVDDGQWQTVALPEELRDARPMDLLTIDGKLVLAMFNHPAPGRLSLTSWSDGQLGPIHPLRRGDGPITWPENDPPAVAAGDGQIALLYQQGERREWVFASADDHGLLSGEPAPLKIHTDSAAQADRVQHVFFAVALGVLMLLILWPGQPLRTGPFALPATMRPASLLKRAVAFFLDMMPFSLLGWLAAGRPEPAQFSSPLVQNGPSLRMMYAFLGAIAAYTVYCMIMERLAGATVGKLALRLRVVGDEGRPPTMREIAVRNISKVPEMMTLIPLVFMVFTRYRQRIGDKIAWTAVVDAAGEAVPPPPPKDHPGDAGENNEEPPKL